MDAEAAACGFSIIPSFPLHLHGHVQHLVVDSVVLKCI